MKLLNRDAPPEAVTFLRVWVFGLWLVELLIHPLGVLGEIPVSLLDPVGVLRAVPGDAWGPLLQPELLTALWVATLALCLLSVVGLWAKPTLLLTSVLLTVHQGLLRSFSFVNHAELSLLLGAYVLTLFALFGPRPPRRSVGEATTPGAGSAPLVTLAFLIALTYSLVALTRFANGRLDIFLSDSMTYWLVSRSHRGNLLTTAFGHLALTHLWLRPVMKGAFFVTTVVELLAPLALVLRWFRYVFLAFVIAFHVIVALFMNILFIEDLFLLVVFLDYRKTIAPLLARLRRFGDAALSRVRPPAAAAVGVETAGPDERASNLVVLKGRADSQPDT